MLKHKTKILNLCIIAETSVAEEVQYDLRSYKNLHNLINEMISTTSEDIFNIELKEFDDLLKRKCKKLYRKDIYEDYTSSLMLIK